MNDLGHGQLSNPNRSLNVVLTLVGNHHVAKGFIASHSSSQSPHNDDLPPPLMAVVLLVDAATNFSCHVLNVARKIILPTNVGSNLANLLLPKQL